MRQGRDRGGTGTPVPPFALPSRVTSTAAAMSPIASKARNAAHTHAVAIGEGFFFCPNEKSSKPR